MQSPCGWHVCPLQEGSKSWAPEHPTGEEAEGETEGRHCQEEAWVYHLLANLLAGLGGGGGGQTLIGSLGYRSLTGDRPGLTVQVVLRIREETWILS